MHMHQKSVNGPTVIRGRRHPKIHALLIALFKFARERRRRQTSSGEAGLAIVRSGRAFFPVMRSAAARPKHFSGKMRTRRGRLRDLVRTISALGFALPLSGAEPTVTLNEKRIHLGIPEAPEWEEFASDRAQPGRFEIRFHATANARESTLFIRQRDVKLEWRVEINRKRVGVLSPMEADLIQTMPVPPGTLTTGENVLAIVPPLEPDDILLHEIILDERPRTDAHDAILSVRVTSPDGAAVPARITIGDANGVLVPVIADSAKLEETGHLALRPGVAYSSTGEARLRLRSGRYTVFASRGLEYGVATTEIECQPGEPREVHLQIERQVPTPGWVSCDPHVHTLTHSRHGDATLAERMVTLAGEGIELPIATDHNVHVDYEEAARRLNVRKFFTPVTGNEVTTKTGHFNIFPVDPAAPVPDAQETDWPRLMTAIRGTRGVEMIILNHPRSIHSGFRPFDPRNFNAATGENKRGFEFTFNALEVLNSGAQQTDYLLVYRDWFALLNYGYRIVTIGASDSHDVSRFIVGQARTYIAAPDQDPSAIDVGIACKNLRQGRASVSMGLLVDMTVQAKFGLGDLATALGEEIAVNVKVLSPAWSRASFVAIYANGRKIREQSFPSPPAKTASGSAREVRWSMPKPAHDVHLVAIVTGPPVTAPFWAMTKPYQPASPKWEGRAIASTNPIWIDADGDGKFSPARKYAQEMIERHGTDPARLLPALGRYDEAVSTQAASLCAAAGAKLNQSPFSDALKSAAPQVAAGFAAYSAAATAGNAAAE